MIITKNQDAITAKVRLYPIHQTCQIIGVGRSKTYEMIKDGRLHAVKIDGKTLVTTKSIDRLLEELGA